MDILDKLQSDQLEEVEVDREELNQMSSEDLRALKTRLQNVIKDVETSMVPEVNGTRKIFRRRNKDCPVESSSKIPVRRRGAKDMRRDPRFEESCGTLDPSRFEKRYQFLDEMKEKEKKIVIRKMKREKDPEKKEQLKKVAQVMKGQQVSKEENKKKEEITERLREEARKTTGHAFVNRSYVKKVTLVERFKQLKKSGKLDKYIEKKRKKLLTKARKNYDV